MSVKLDCLAEKHGRKFSEVSRRIVSDTAVETEYRAGYTTVMVKSNFGNLNYADLLYNIAVQNLVLKTSVQPLLI